VITNFSEEVSWLKDVAPGELRRIVDALYRVHGLIAAITDLDTLLERIMEESKEVANAQASSLMLYDEDRDELHFHVALGESGDQQALKREIRLKLGEGIAGTAGATRQSINVRDAQQDPRFYRQADAASRFETRAILAVPMVDRDKLVGVLEVVNKVDEGHFTDTDLHVMEMFSNLAATAIVNARLIEENLRSARLAAIGEAVTGLSHYTKNIITGMTGSADLIDQGLQQGNAEFLQRSWPILRRSIKRISHVVEDMLAYSKPRDPMLEPCDLDALVEEVTQAFWGLLHRRNIRLEVDTSRLNGPIQVDSRGLHRCLLNLLGNAADAAPATDGVVRVVARPIDEGVCIEVSDNGPGVPDDIREKIFEPFFSTKGTRGTGLGLAVTNKIVKEHRGRIEVERSAEGGALFRIALPQQREGA
jgi:signal transduction histidine kinase